MMRWTIVLLTCCGIGFGEARRTGTSDALRTFASENRDHPKALKALEMADAMDWEAATTADTEAGYLTYLDDSAGGKWENDAKRGAAAACWRDIARDDPKAVRSYLETYPGWDDEADAMRVAEAHSMEASEAAGTVEAWVKHVETYPKGVKVADALHALRKLTWPKVEALMKQETPPAKLLAQVEIQQPEWRPSAAIMTTELYGFLAYLMNDHDLARSLYDASGAVVPGAAYNLNNQALLLKREQAWEEEEALYRQILDVDRTELAALNNLALSLTRQKRFDEADQALDRVEKVADADAFYNLHRAAYHLAKGDEDEGWVHLERMVAGMPMQEGHSQVEILENLRLDPLFEGVRKDSRFASLPTAPLEAR